MPIKLFISHSSKTKNNLKKFNGVCDNLEDAGYTVLVDRSIPGGDEWRRRLFEWMAECDAAIILMSVDAFDSVWVQAESTILTWRRYIDNNFKLICVLLDDGVKPDDLSDDPLFGVTRPGEYNLIRYENLDEQLKKIKTSLGAPDNESNTPFKDLVERMSDVLANLGPNAEQTLQRAWNHLNSIDKPQWKPGMNFADALTRLLVREPENALQNLYDLLFEIKQLVDNPKAETMLDIVRGLWVRPEAASLIMLARRKNEPAAINCSREKFTGKS